MENNNIKNYWLGLGTTLLFMLAFLGWQHNTILTSANSKVIEGYGDGMKIYTNLLYHIRFDSSYWHFEGMNYPYGEHVIPADCQPSLSNPLKWLYNQGLPVDQYTTAIQHVVLFGSIILGALLLFQLFWRWKLPWFWAAIGAIGISLLSPQIERVGAHLNLAYLFVIPGLLVLLQRLERKPELRFSIWIGLYLTVVAGLHFYYLAVGLLIVGIYLFVSLVRKFEIRRWMTLALHGIFQIGIPIAVYTKLLILADTVTDRSAHPYGFFSYQSSFEKVFLTNQLPHHARFSRLFDPLFDNPEGFAYVGLVAIFGILALVVGTIIYRKEVFRRLFPTDHWFAVKLLIIGVGGLVLSIGFPFNTFPSLLDYAGPLKQFRSIGRFAWVFYYCLNIVSWVLFWNLIRNLRPWFKDSIAAALILILLFEGLSFGMKKRYNPIAVDEWQDGQRFTDLRQIDFTDFQAVIPMSYFNIGSEIRRLDGGFGVQKGMTLAAQTGVPITGAMLTRSSLSQTLKQYQLVDPPLVTPTILEDFPNQKPLLVLWFTAMDSLLQERYRHLIDNSNRLAKYKQWELYELPLEVFPEIVKQQQRKRAALRPQPSINPLDSTLVEPYSWTTSFDQQSAPHVRSGTGAFELANLTAGTVIAEKQLDFAEANKTLTVEFWMYYPVDESYTTTFTLREIETGGQILQTQSIRPSQVKPLLLDENLWGKLSFDLTTQSPNSTLQLTAQHDHANGSGMVVDDVTIFETWKE